MSDLLPPKIPHSIHSKIQKLICVVWHALKGSKYSHPNENISVLHAIYNLLNRRREISVFYLPTNRDLFHLI
jgi:hypothetical protein